MSVILSERALVLCAQGAKNLSPFDSMVKMQEALRPGRQRDNGSDFAGAQDDGHWFVK